MLGVTMFINEGSHATKVRSIAQMHRYRAERRIVACHSTPKKSLFSLIHHSSDRCRVFEGCYFEAVPDSVDQDIALARKRPQALDHQIKTHNSQKTCAEHSATIEHPKPLLLERPNLLYTLHEEESWIACTCTM